MLPLEAPGSAAFGLVLAIAAHSVGWPVARGGAQNLADALVSYARSVGVEFVTGRRIAALGELPAARAVLCDVTPRQLLALAEKDLPSRFQRRLQSYRYGMGAFKIDWALAAPVPWKAADCARAATVHVGGTFEEIAASERAAARGELIDYPFVLLAQPSLFDDTRAPRNKHTLWGYCHVPHGSNQNRLAQIEQQIERFAPGFGDLVLARSIRPPAELERHNANLIGGDINGGAADIGQYSCGRRRAITKPPSQLYTSARHPPRRAGACMACAAISPLNECSRITAKFVFGAMMRPWRVIFSSADRSKSLLHLLVAHKVI